MHAYFEASCGARECPFSVAALWRKRRLILTGEDRCVYNAAGIIIM
jgi:hypothetical protein